MDKQYTATIDFLAEYRKHLLEIKSPITDATRSARILQEQVKEYYSSPLYIEIQEWHREISKKLSENLYNSFHEKLYGSTVTSRDISKIIKETIKDIDFQAIRPEEPIDTRSIDLQIFAESSDDYVIVDEAPIREFNVPDELVIPLGNNRVRISTGLLIAIISLILTLISLSSGATSENQEKQIQIMNEILDSLEEPQEATEQSEQPEPSSIELMQL